MKVKSKVRMGAAALLLLCASLSLCSRSCVSNLVSALEKGGEGQPELLAAPPWASYKPVPVSVPVPKAHGELDTGRLSPTAGAHLRETENWL